MPESNVVTIALIMTVIRIEQASISCIPCRVRTLHHLPLVAQCMVDTHHR